MPIARLLRGLTRAPSFSFTVAATLAIGVAALTVSFGVVDAALWREPPFDDAAHLAIIYTERSDAARALRPERWSFPRIQLLRAAAGSFEQIANFSPTTLSLTRNGDPEPVQGEIVSPEYFPLLHAAPLRGRVFAAVDDDARDPHAVAIISFALWQRRFAGDSAVLGRSADVNGVPLTMIGVMGPGFRGLTDRADLWIPTALAPSISYGEFLTTNQNFISVVGRLRAGVALSTANAELATVGPRINAQLPPGGAKPGETLTAAAVPLNAARTDTGTRRSLLVLLGAVALLHLLACANVVNLLLGRAASRRREAALRAALGGTTAQLARHFGAEVLVLAGIGGAAGVLLAAWIAPLLSVPANAWFARNFFGSIGTFDSPDGGVRTIAFGLAVAALTALLSACAPLIGLWRLDPISGLSVGARAAAAGGGSLKRPSARGIVVALETALAVLLVVAAGLMIESFDRMRHTDLGIRPEHLLTFWIRPSEVRVPPREAPRFISRILDAIAKVPGVTDVSVDGGTPLSGSASSTLLIVGRPVPAKLGDAPPVDRHYVAPGHFRALGVPLVRGRAFTDADDADHPRVAIISESAARKFWPGQGEDPLGQRVWFGGGSNFDRPDSSAEIVGIVGDVADEPLDARPNRASFYTPYRQFTYASRAVFVRTTVDPTAIVPAVRKAVASAAPDLPLYDVQTMEQRIGGSWARHRFDAGLFGLFGAAALLLAAFGMYVVVAYAVARRTREMGIRVALGALPRSVVQLVVREGLTFPAIGLVIGAALAVAFARLLRAQLYGVGPTDPLVFAATSALLLAVSTLACIVPALRATRADPLEALHAE